MSSTIRRFSQIPVRTKYLLGVASATISEGNTTGDNFGIGGGSVILVSNAAYVIPPTANTVELTDALVGATVTQPFTTNTLVGKLFKDMGRQVTVYDPDIIGDLHIATYRECQLVSGGGSEGVIDSSPEYGATYWVRVWAADGAGVAVARTG